MDYANSVIKGVKPPTYVEPSDTVSFGIVSTRSEVFVAPSCSPRVHASFIVSR